MCDSVKNCDKLIANEISAINVDEWAHITVTGRVNAPEMMRGESRIIIETNEKGVVSEDVKDYLIVQ
jgi:hypothetical protein